MTIPKDLTMQSPDCTFKVDYNLKTTTVMTMMTMKNSTNLKQFSEITSLVVVLIVLVFYSETGV